jgi:NAD(P)-dependent dehydrogenase (short-subunit alcohol dehydrogenase family)
MTQTYRGQRIVVTGASSGVGLATARYYTAHGARVAMLARRGTVLRDLARELGQNAIPITTDVGDSESTQAAMAAAEVRLGGFDTVISCAGIAYPTPLDDMTISDWDTTIATNLSGSFYVAHYAAKRMRDHGGGVIVNISSELGIIGMTNYIPYCASKAGVIGLTRALAAELAPTVRVNAICPGPIDTPQMDTELEWFDDPYRARQEAIERVPMKRFATADEVVAAIDFLAYQAPFATGTIMALDGGTTAV